MKNARQLAEELARMHPQAMLEELRELAVAESDEPGFAAEVIKEHLWITARVKSQHNADCDG